MEKQEIKEKKILDFLATGEKITNYQATVWFGYTDLRSYACRLIDKGLNIMRVRPEGCRHKEYWWVKEEVAA